jgi:chromosome segregation ATPase
MGRKLGDREAQVNELVHMVRYLRDSNALLLEGVATAEGARQSSVSSMTIGSTVPPAGAMQLVSLMVDALQLSSAFFRSQSSTLHSLHTLEQTLVTNHRASSHALLLGLETDASIVETSERYASLVLSHFQHQVPQLTEKLSLQEAELAAVHSSACEQASRLQELQMRREEEIRRTQETEECLAIERDQTKRMRKEIGEKDGRLRKLAGEVEALRREEARLSTRIAKYVPSQSVRAASLQIEHCDFLDSMEESLNDNLQLQEEHRELLERGMIYPSLCS